MFLSIFLRYLLIFRYPCENWEKPIFNYLAFSTAKHMRIGKCILWHESVRKCKEKLFKYDQGVRLLFLSELFNNHFLVIHVKVLPLCPSHASKFCIVYQFFLYLYLLWRYQQKYCYIHNNRYKDIISKSYIVEIFIIYVFLIIGPFLR